MRVISLRAHSRRAANIAYLRIHSPHAGDNVHREDNGTQNGELAENVVGLLCTLIHTDVNLSKVVAVCSRKEAELVSVTAGGPGVLLLGLTFRNGTSFLSWLRRDLEYRQGIGQSQTWVRLPNARCISWQNP